MPPENKTELLHKAGQGNWKSFTESNFDIDVVFEQATHWKNQLSDVERPWLCWNVNNDWCLVQQRLVESVGWTPVVGYDPRVGPPNLSKNAILIDFNNNINLPVMYPHFPLEFAFLFVEKIAFWHSDIVMPFDAMKKYADRFLGIEDGTTIGTTTTAELKYRFARSRRRYWELLGCTTRSASKSQFEAGAGWWMDYTHHMNCPGKEEQNRRTKYHWDHGGGIYYWEKFYGGNVEKIPGKELKNWHFTKINNPDYVRSWPRPQDSQRHMSVDLTTNFDLTEICKNLEIEALLYQD